MNQKLKPSTSKQNGCFQDIQAHILLTSLCLNLSSASKGNLLSNLPDLVVGQNRPNMYSTFLIFFSGIKTTTLLNLYV